MSTASAERIAVEVAYARAERQLVIPLQVSAGTSAAEAVRLSGLLEEFPEIDLEHAALGIFSRPIAHEQVLGPGDRVEIYRPLAADPKEVRRRLAAQGKTMGRRGAKKG